MFTAPAELPQELQPVEVNSPNRTTLSAASALEARMRVARINTAFTCYLLFWFCETELLIYTNIDLV